MPKIDRQAIYERDRGLCGFCGEHVPLELLHLDHIVPRGLNGPTTPENLRVAHKACNIAAGALVVPERRRLGIRPDQTRTLLRIDSDVYRRLRQLARREYRSCYQQIIYILEQAVADVD